MAFEMKRGELNMGSFVEIEDADHKRAEPREHLD
jgi:hypothetical protein